ncbi:hypothetical protein CLAIMM_03092 [Cladophialophora immunda]|nr:hypothetical protein CLAIMM_03092 [Cladophialophora immunda]
MAPGITRQWNGWNFFICFLVSLGQVAFAYPASVISVTLAQPSFLIYMGLLDPTTGALSHNANGIIGAMSGVFLAGGAVNVFISGWIADKYGRKPAFYYCSLLGILGSGLITGSRNVGMYIAGRLIAGASSLGFLATTPFFTAELAPPALRGLMVGMNGFNIAVGYALAPYMGIAFYFSTNPAEQWRAPCGIALIFPVLMGVICLIVPESPRFLLMKGRLEEARTVVFQLHAVKGDHGQDFARGEFFQMMKQAEKDRELIPSWLEMFRKKSYRKRLMLAAVISFFGQSTGVLVLNNYGPTIYAALGYDTEKQLAFQAGWVTMGVVANLVGALIVDKIGRRPLLMFSFCGCCVCLILEAAMVAVYGGQTANHAGLQMGVAATYLFLFLYSMGADVASYCIYSELFPNFMRARGLSVTIAVLALTDILYLQLAPTAFASIGWKYYLVFIILSAISVVWIYFVVPETKEIPLEEMARIFGDEVVVYQADIHPVPNTDELVVEHHHAHGASVAQEVCLEDISIRGIPSPATKDIEHGGGAQATELEYADNLK